MEPKCCRINYKRKHLILSPGWHFVFEDFFLLISVRRIFFKFKQTLSSKKTTRPETLSISISHYFAAAWKLNTMLSASNDLSLGSYTIDRQAPRVVKVSRFADTWKEIPTTVTILLIDTNFPNNSRCERYSATPTRRHIE